MNIVFRADASSQMGTGHVMRCLTLADALHAQGARCRFICREHAGHLIPLIRQRGFDVAALAGAATRTSDRDEIVLPHADWLGVHWSTDAQQTKESLRGSNVDWLVVDHYALDSRWEAEAQQPVERILAIDDIADRTHDCDLLLDQNWYGDATDHRYVDLVAERCLCLLGPAYALLGPEYARIRAAMSPRDGVVRRVMVFLGGSDPENYTGLVLEAMIEPDLEGLALDLVLGPNHPDVKGIERAAAKRPDTTVSSDLPTLADLMARSDLMIGGGGSTGWQRLCLGLPAIVIGIADNQHPTNAALHDAGYIDYLGPADGVSAAAVANAVRRAVGDREQLIQRGRLGQELVSGSGAAIVSRLMLSEV